MVRFTTVFPSYAKYDFRVPEQKRNGEDIAAEQLTCVIRTDAEVATEFLRKKILEQVKDKSAEYVSGVINTHYKEWGGEAIQALQDHLNYDEYRNHILKEKIQVHFFRAAEASQQVVVGAMDLIRGDPVAQQGGYILLSLDDMIRPVNDNLMELAFSRKFDPEGRTEKGYVSRPGCPPLEDQIENIRLRVNQLSHQFGEKKIPLVFLEDNIRRAKMMLFIIDKLRDAGVFDKSFLAGISTCFCSADDQERSKISVDGRQIPIVAFAKYDSKNSDVITPRDFLFDGLVVEIGDHVGRLPAVFMDLAARFKIRAECQEIFRGKIVRANVGFCEAVERDLGVKIPLAWMEHGETIARYWQCETTKLLVDVMTELEPYDISQMHCAKGLPHFSMECHLG